MLRKKDRSNKCLNAAATQTVTEKIVSIYNKARIPTKHLKNMAQLHQQMLELTKIPEKKRASGKSKEKLESFKLSLKQTMVFWPKNVYELVKMITTKSFCFTYKLTRW